MSASREATASDRSVGSIVSVQGMTRRYGDVVAAEDVTFEVRRGEMFGLIGPDGAGKTTTLRVILGLLAPQAGTVRTCGLEPVKQGTELSQRIGYLSQRFSLYGDLTVDENIAFFASIHGVKGWKPRRDELLDLLRMTPFRKRLADRLSGGMKQKLALACTLIHTPELLVLDEPTTGVDPVSRRDFWKILAHLQREGLTLLVTTPYLDEAERCQRIALMDHGRLLTVDAPSHLKAEAGAAIVEILARPKRQALERLRELPEVADVQSFGERLHATLRGIDRSGAEAAASRLAADLAAHGAEVEIARPVLPTLEDIFIARIEAGEPQDAAAVR
jgi:drug efflux transport system ATP-binding protein